MKKILKFMEENEIYGREVLNTPSMYEKHIHIDITGGKNISIIKFTKDLSFMGIYEPLWEVYSFEKLFKGIRKFQTEEETLEFVKGIYERIENE